MELRDTIGVADVGCEDTKEGAEIEGGGGVEDDVTIGTAEGTGFLIKAGEVTEVSALCLFGLGGEDGGE